MFEKFDFEAGLKALQSGQPITGKGGFPNDNSLQKLLYMGVINASEKPR